PPPTYTLFTYTTLFRSAVKFVGEKSGRLAGTSSGCQEIGEVMLGADSTWKPRLAICGKEISTVLPAGRTLIFQASAPTSGSVPRSEEHTSELQSRFDLV